MNNNGVMRNSKRLESSEDVSKLLASLDLDVSALLDLVITKVIFNKERFESLLKINMDTYFEVIGIPSKFGDNLVDKELNVYTREVKSKLIDFNNYYPLNNKSLNEATKRLLVYLSKKQEVKDNKKLARIATATLSNYPVKCRITENMLLEFFVDFTENELSLLIKRGVNNLTFKEIGEFYNISKSRVSQIYKRIIVSSYNKYIMLRECNKGWENSIDLWR